MGRFTPSGYPAVRSNFRYEFPPDLSRAPTRPAIFPNLLPDFLHAKDRFLPAKPFPTIVRPDPDARGVLVPARGQRTRPSLHPGTEPLSEQPPSQGAPAEACGRDQRGGGTREGRRVPAQPADAKFCQAPGPALRRRTRLQEGDAGAILPDGGGLPGSGDVGRSAGTDGDGQGPPPPGRPPERHRRHGREGAGHQIRPRERGRAGLLGRADRAEPADPRGCARAGHQRVGTLPEGAGAFDPSAVQERPKRRPSDEHHGKVYGALRAVRHFGRVQRGGHHGGGRCHARRHRADHRHPHRHGAVGIRPRDVLGEHQNPAKL